MPDLLRDVTLAVRRLGAAPGFTLFAMLTLALGIGISSAVYSVIRGTLLRPPQLRDIDRVVNIYHSYPFGRSLPAIALSYPDFNDLSWSQKSFQQLAAWTRIRTTVSGGGMSGFVLGEVVSGTYFQLTGASARIGRTLLPSDGVGGAPSVLVISESFWRRQFASDPNVVGQTLTVNGRPAEIVGVIALPFRGVDMPNILPTAMWLPVPFAVGVDRENSVARATDRDARVWLVKGRLRDGVTREQAAAEIAAIARQFDQAFPIGDESARLRRDPVAIERRWQVVPAADVRIHESMHLLVTPVAITLAVMVTLVLLVVATNLANLLLARGSARRHELAVRAALGGSRARIVREQLIECVMVAIVSGIGGLWIARSAVAALASRSIRLGPGVWLELTLGIDASVLIMTAALTLLAFVIFGVVPAMRLTRHDLQRTLQANEHTGAVSRWRGRALLIGTQVTVSVMLVAVALSSVDYLIRSLRQDTGVDVDNIAAAQIDFRLAGHDEPRARQTLQRLVDVAARDSHIERVALSSGLPMGLPAPAVAVGASGELRKVYATLLAVSPSIWDVLGIAVPRGRQLSDADGENQPRVAVISTNLAQTLYGTADVVGRSIVLFERLERDAKPLLETYTIAGVAEDTDVGAVGRRDGGVLYVPFAQHYEPRMAIVARTSQPDAAASALPELLRRVDAAIAVTDVGTGMSLTGIANVPVRITAALTGSLGIVALILAMSGLYGVLSFVVAGRRREIGVRRALGATSPTVMRLIILDGLRPVVAGLACGLLAGGLIQFGASRFVRNVAATDPLVLVVVPVLFVLAGLLAAYLPARRASTVDPSVVLREL